MGKISKLFPPFLITEYILTMYRYSLMFIRYVTISFYFHTCQGHSNHTYTKQHEPYADLMHGIDIGQISHRAPRPFGNSYSVSVWLALACSGWLWLSLAGSGWLWLHLAGSGWLLLGLASSGLLWLALTGSGCLWLALAGSGWLWLALSVSGRDWMLGSGSTYCLPDLQFCQIGAAHIRQIA